MAVPALVACLEIVVRLLFTTALLARVDVRLLVLPAFGLPALALAGGAERIRLRALDERRPAERRERDLFDLATAEPPAKELRLFALGPELLRRHAEESAAIAGNELRHRLQGSALILVGRLLFAVGYLLALAVVVERATHGGLSVRDLVLTIGLASQVMGQLSSVSNRANWLNWSLTAVRDVVWLEDLVRTAVDVGQAGIPPPPRLGSGITFDGVSFAYPGTDTTVLSDLDLTLDAGTVVAVVGDNGAGKSTLVKLLCRFYETSAGVIRVDGVDLRAIDLARWRQRIGAAFQDHARYEVTASSVVGIGDLPRLGDPAAVRAALDAAGAGALVDGLPDGIDSLLGNAWGGAELSGGEWQRRAVARATMRLDPLLLVLDEPTAALDAEAEHLLFERYAGAAGDARRRSGAITIVVSHRFSTVRMADLILVVGGGRVIERGTHDELILLGGAYAHLFRIQAGAYR
ncbi:MAG: ABC transporter ATP-binding protein [Acidimicrobiales bacterium]